MFREGQLEGRKGWVASNGAARQVPRREVNQGFLNSRKPPPAHPILQKSYLQVRQEMPLCAFLYTYIKVIGGVALTSRRMNPSWCTSWYLKPDRYCEASLGLRARISQPRQSGATGLCPSAWQDRGMHACLCPDARSWGRVPYPNGPENEVGQRNVAAPLGQERADKEGTTQLMTCQGDEIMS